MTQQLFADDLTVGQLFAGSTFVLDDQMVRGFADLTGDAHPIHYDEAYAARSAFGRPVVHGLLLVSLTALGATPLSSRVEASMIALIEQASRFLRPAFVGDSVTSSYHVRSVRRRSSDGSGIVCLGVKLTNAADEVIIDGRQIYLLRFRH